MKKLLVLSLVLAIGAVSSAALTLTTPKTELGLGELATFTVASNAGAKSFMIYAIIDDGGVGVLSSPVVLTGDPALNAVNPYTEAGWGTGYEVGLANGTVVKVVAGDFFTFQFSSDVKGTAVVSIWDAANGFVAADQAITMTVVPEPMTMGLLALGALFLRKR